MNKIISFLIIVVIFSGCQQFDKDVSTDNYKIKDIEVLTDKENDDLSSKKETIEENSNSKERTQLDKPEDDILNSKNIIESNIYKFVQNNDFTYDDTLLNLYIDILNSQATFKSQNYATGMDEVIYLNELMLAVDAPLKPVCYSLLDMDKDSVPELLVGVTTGSVYFTIVFRFNEGEIYSYWFSNKDMSEIKVDGTFFHSGGGAGYYRIDELEFIDDQCLINYLACHDAGLEVDEDGNILISYYLNKEKVIQKEFESFIDDFKKKEDASWCEFP